MPATLTTKSKPALALASNKVGASLLQRKCACGNGAGLDGMCEDCRETRLQRRSIFANASTAAPPIVPEVLRSPGQPLDPQTRASMEPRFGHDFSKVRVHEDAPAKLQTKLTIGKPGDQYELEADRAAEQVMRMPNAGPLSLSLKNREAMIEKRIQRDTRNPHDEEEGLVPEGQEEQEEEESIQTKLWPNYGPRMTPELESQINGLGHGHALPSSTRSFMEPRFGHDFSRVRIHADAQAAEAANSANARAFTLGSELIFGTGQYAPATDGGRWLLAHELTHVIQQGHAPAFSSGPHQPRAEEKNSASQSLDGEATAAELANESSNLTEQISSNSSAEPNTIRRVVWHPNTDTGQDSFPWRTGPNGDVLRATTDAGSPIDIWRPHDGSTYWCHGYTFGGSTARGGPYSMWGESVPKVLNDDGWQRVNSCVASSGDILAFYTEAGSVAHTGITRTVSAPGGTIDEARSTLQSKWGQEALNTSPWLTNINQYGKYRCYSKNPAYGPCRANGANELP